MSIIIWGGLLVLAGLELALCGFDFLWRGRRFWAVICMIAWVGSLLLMIGQFQQAVALWLFGLLVGFRLINLARVVYGRTQELYLRQVVERTSLWLLVYLGLVVPLCYGWPGGELLVYGGLGAQLGVALFVAVSTFTNIHKSRLRLQGDTAVAKDELTVSVAIPARNETADLVDCLQTVLASTYSRLEVIVLDDCSQQGTSDIIRSFAHSGVRFVPGEPPRDGWLAKNQAYDVLTQQASGDLILFCGADTRFDPHTISQMVQLYQAEQLNMLTIMPFWPTTAWRWAIIQPLRFWWELALPRFAMGQPASLSSCWLVDRRWVLKLGGFRAVSSNVRPEKFFARQAAKLSKYQFKISPPSLGVTSHKRPGEQFDTAIRLRYPELHRRPESVLALSLFVLVFFIMPFLEVLMMIVLKQWFLVALILPTLLLLITSHLQIMRISSRRSLLVGLLNFPIVAAAEIVLINLSMYRYEFRTVTWKGRNICLPVMHAESYKT